jgi:purine-binding chemotaxis protein CheW
MTDLKTETTNQYLTFVMGGENYAIPVTSIREVLIVPKVTRIPRMPDFMRGVINLRGSVVPILDLKLKFGIGETEMTNETAIVVVEIPFGNGGGEEGLLHLGIFTDAVKKVLTISREEIEPPPKIGTKIKTSFILGMGHVEENFIVILDIREVLSDEDLAIAESAKDMANEP